MPLAAGSSVLSSLFVFVFVCKVDRGAGSVPPPPPPLRACFVPFVCQTQLLRDLTPPLLQTLAEVLQQQVRVDDPHALRRREYERRVKGEAPPMSAADLRRARWVDRPGQTDRVLRRG
jgi:hypothetical protein